MKIPHLPQYVAACAAAGAAILAGCNSSGFQSQLDPSGAIHPNAAQSRLNIQPLSRFGPLSPENRVAMAVHPDHSRSWMDPDAKKKKLLYISDNGTDDVYVYSYPQGELKGTLTQFDNPQGECVDKAGDIWITDANSSEILEYAHGGASPIATLSDPGQSPLGCSVDPKTGNLAITNWQSTSGAPGSVSIYPDAQGTPTNYTDSSFNQMFFLGYDNKGNLFVDGVDSSGNFEFAELPKGQEELTNITLNQNIATPGGVQWDGTHLAVGDQGDAVIYQFTISGNDGTEVGSTQLADGNFRQTVLHPRQDGRRARLRFGLRGVLELPGWR